VTFEVNELAMERDFLRGTSVSPAYYYSNVAAESFLSPLGICDSPEQAEYYHILDL
jgi:hypothetical protein